MKPTGMNYLLPGLFLTECNFANFLSFRNKYKKVFTEMPFNRDEVIKKLNELTSVKEGKIDQEKAEQLLLAEDLRNIRNNLLEADIPEPENQLKEHYEKIKSLVEKHGIMNKFPDYYVVDNFPKPFENMEWTCMFLDEEEKEVYNIEPGVYLKRDFLEVYASSMNLIHELIHMAISQNSEEKDIKGIARGLEDGICDVFGSLFLFSELTNKELAKNLLKYSKFNYKESQMTSLYRDNIRMALLVYKQFGLDGLVDIIKSGRGNLKSIEQKCLNGDYDLDIKKGNWKKEFDNLADYFLGFQRHLVVSPLAYYTSKVLKEKQSVDELINENNLDESARDALKELQERAFLITLNEDKVEYDDSKRYLTGALRYENS